MAKTRPQAAPAGVVERNGQGEGVYFLSLTLTNIRCFADAQTLNLAREGRPARWTIMLGENGCGKTTILQVLARLEPTRFRDDRRLIHIATAWQDFYRNEDTHSLISASITRGHRLQLPQEVWIPVGVEVSFQHKEMSSWLQPDECRELCCYAYGASRRLSEGLVLGSPEDDPIGSLFADDFRLRNAEEWLLQADYSASKPSAVQQQQRQRLEMVKQVLLQVLPDEVSAIRITEPTAERRTPRVEFRTPYGWVGLRNLGHGYRTLIAWVVDFASRLCDRDPDSPTPLDQPAVALVDEIDLHMHPVWQRKVMGHLSKCFPNTQFIVTAHSPLIVQAAGDDANIALLRREGDHVVIENDLERIRGWRVDQLLTSDLFNLPSARPPQFDELFARRRAILQKSKLTKQDKEELARIDEQLGPLPTSETPEVIQLMADLRQSLEQANSQRKKAE